MRVLLSLLLVAGGARAQVFLEWCTPPLTSEGDTGVGNIVMADFDEDGLSDALISNFVGGASLMQYIGQRDGTLVEGLAVPQSTLFATLRAADLNGDGHADVAATGQYSSASFVSLVGDGAGGLSVAQTAASAAWLATEALGDVDGDGALDVVTAAWNEPASVRYGLGDGTFLQPKPIGLTAQRPVAVELGDLDGDGAPDLVVAHDAARLITRRLNLGGGRFGPPASFDLTSNPADLELADLDGDGRLDAVATQDAEGSISVLAGDGAGGFLTPLVFPTNPQPAALRAVDLDGDGRPELVVSHDNGIYDYAVRALSTHTLGPGGWSAPSGISSGSCMSLDTGDIDGDGHPEAVTAKGNAFTVTTGGGDGLLGPPTFAYPSTQHDVLATDLDGDGKLDAIAISMTGSSLSVQHGDGAGGMGPLTIIAIPPVARPTAITAADLAEDGRMDLATASQAGGSVGIVLGLTGGALSAPAIFAAGLGARDIAAADFDGDGHVDLVTADEYAATVSRLAGAGNGRFGAPVAQLVGSGPTRLDVADIDGDGLPDVLVSCLGDESVVALLADGAGGWSSGVVDADTSVLAAATLADLSADGVPDLVVVRDTYTAQWTWDGNVAVRLGDGAGAFAPPKIAIAAWGAVDIETGDFDGDGATDVLLACTPWNASIHAYSVLNLLPGDGAGGLGAAERYGAGLAMNAAAAADLDVDGAPDVLAVSREPGWLWLLLNRTGAAGP